MAGRRHFRRRGRQTEQETSLNIPDAIAEDRANIDLAASAALRRLRHHSPEPFDEGVIIIAGCQGPVARFEHRTLS